MTEQRVFLELNEIIPRIHAEIHKRKSFCIKGLAALLAIADLQPDKELDLYEELPSVLGDIGILLNRTELNELARIFNTNSNGKATYKEIMNEIAPPLPECRLKAVEMAFASVDPAKNGSVPISSISALHSKHSKSIPRLATKKTNGEIQFNDLVSIFSDVPEITRDDFLAFYREVSTSYQNDQDFAMMMNSVWSR